MFLHHCATTNNESAVWMHVLLHLCLSIRLRVCCSGLIDTVFLIQVIVSMALCESMKNLHAVGGANFTKYQYKNIITWAYG